MDECFIFHSNEIERNFGRTSWQAKVFREFDSMLSSEARPFPCVYGVSSHRTHQLRFTFHDLTTAQALAGILHQFLPVAREIGPLASLVVFEAPQPVQSVESYRQRFWTLLNDVTALDDAPWPDHVPRDTQDPHWEFCFAGEPIFVVCNTPAHIARQSRRSSVFTLTFQPRWVFDKILDTQTNAQRAFTAVRSRLREFDFVTPSPSLGLYGEPGVFEAEQYFLDEFNTKLPCPFKQLGASET